MSHTQQQIDGVHRSLNNAGIRRAYHTRVLKDYPSKHAAQLLDWVTTGDRETGLVLIGSVEMEDLAILTARGLHLTGTTAQVMNFLTFVDGLTKEREWLEERIDRAKCLTLLRAGPSLVGDEVFTKREIRYAELRITDWLEEGNMIILQAMHPLSSGWFSKEFLQRVANSTKTVGEWK